MQLLVMKFVLCVIVFCVFRCDGAMITLAEPVALNNRPIIGILAQEQPRHLAEKYAQENFTSYIAASYVKDVEASGARVVPIMIGQNEGYYRNIMGKINGVLFPGGGTYFNQSNGYADAGQHIYNIALELNSAGDYFPLFGTCLGFELLIILASGRGEPENRETCNSFNTESIYFTKDFRSSKMFRDIKDDIKDKFEHQKLTINAHQFCILDKNLESHGLTADWRATSHAFDSNGLKFISSVENKRYPFYGVQFHPEKAPFEWKLERNYIHTQDAINVNRYFMNFFVQECRKNFHGFENQSEENDFLIYNYSPSFSGKRGSSYTQCYFFEPRGVVSKL